MRTKLSKYLGMITGLAAIILVFLGVLGFFMWQFGEAELFHVRHYQNYILASIPFSLLAICCTLMAMERKKCE